MATLRHFTCSRAFSLNSASIAAISQKSSPTYEPITHHGQHMPTIAHATPEIKPRKKRDKDSCFSFEEDILKCYGLRSRLFDLFRYFIFLTSSFSRHCKQKFIIQIFRTYYCSLLRTPRIHSDRTILMNSEVVSTISSNSRSTLPPL